MDKLTEERQQTLTGHTIKPECSKILREVHNMKLNGELFSLNEKADLNKFFHYKEKKLDNYK